MNDNPHRALSLSLRVRTTRPPFCENGALFVKTMQAIRESRHAIRRTDGLIASISKVYCGFGTARGGRVEG